MKRTIQVTARRIVRQLIAKGYTVGTAESCTGGGIAAALTSISGSSACVRGGVVSYATEVKEEVLGVKQKTIARNGVVSEQTVTEMALGAQRVLNCDYAVATSGISGPTGGTQEIPVGTVWMAVASPDGTVRTYCMTGKDEGRTKNTQNAVEIALLLLLDAIEKG